jgi:hypothetical protein
MSDQPPASVSDAHVWEVERLLDKLRAEEEGHRNFPLIQALEALLGRLPVAQCNLDGDCKCEMCRRAREQTLAAWQQRRAGVSLPVPPARYTERDLAQMFSDGVDVARSYGDNAFHLYGEQLQRQFHRALTRLVNGEGQNVMPSEAGVSLPVEPQEPDEPVK